MNAENFLAGLTFWLFVVGLSLDVALAVVALINIHYKKGALSPDDERRKARLEKSIAWLASLSALLVLMAILSEHRVDALRADQIKKLSQKFPRHLTLGQERQLESMVSLISIKPHLRIFLNEDAPDAEQLASQLLRSFHESGFVFDSDEHGISMTGETGIMVGEFGGASDTPQKIVAALNQCGLSAKTNGGNPAYPGNIFIAIERP